MTFTGVPYEAEYSFSLQRIFFKKTSALKGLFDVCLVHFVNNVNHMSLLTLIRNLELEK